MNEDVLREFAAKIYIVSVCKRNKMYNKVYERTMARKIAACFYSIGWTTASRDLLLAFRDEVIYNQRTLSHKRTMLFYQSV